MSATEASRNFSDLLDLVEAGETVRITRGHDLVAEVGPVHRRSGAELEAALLAADLPPLDDDLEGDIGEALALVDHNEGDPWAAA